MSLRRTLGLTLILTALAFYCAAPPSEPPREDAEAEMNLPRSSRGSTSGGLVVEVDGIRLGMSRDEVERRTLRLTESLQQGRVVYDRQGTVIGVVSGKRLKVVSSGETELGALKDRALEILGDPLRLEPGVAGCGLDPTASWRFPVEGGGLRVFFYRDRHQQLEIPETERSSLVSFDLSHTLNGSFRGP